MDLNSLSRRKLQALCKRNKIPANLTNVAMADSLKALKIVEGSDDVLQACKSEIAQSSIEPRVRLEAPSPYMNVTPAPSGVTSRRRRAAKGGSAVTQVTGTRRSARLAEKSGRLLKGIGSVYTDFSKDLFTGDGQELKINLEESLDSLDEMSGVTDMEESYEKKYGQVDTADKQNVSTDVELETTIKDEITERLTEKNAELIKVGNYPDLLKKDLSSDDCIALFKEIHDGSDEIVGVTGLDENSEKYSEAQVASSENQDMSIDEYLEPPIEDEMINFSEIDGAKEGGSMEVKEQGDGLQSFALAVVIANTKVEVNSDLKDESEVEKVELVPKAVDVITELNEGKGAEIDQGFGSKINVDFGIQNCDDAGSVEVSSDDDETFNDEDSDPKEDTVLDENEEVLEPDTDSSETESNADETASVMLELTEESSKTNDSLECMGSEVSSMSYQDDNKASKQDLATEEETGAVQPAANVIAIDQVSCTDPTYQIAVAAPKNTTTSFMEKDPSFIIQPPLLTPQRASSAIRSYPRRFRITAASDNKENIGSGSKTAPAKERPKIVKDIAETVPMFDQSLIKNLKDLQITHKSDKNEGETEASARTALQPLPQNKTSD